MPIESGTLQSVEEAETTGSSPAVPQDQRDELLSQGLLTLPVDLPGTGAVTQHLDFDVQAAGR